MLLFLLPVLDVRVRVMVKIRVSAGVADVVSAVVEVPNDNLNTVLSAMIKVHIFSKTAGYDFPKSLKKQNKTKC